MIHHSKSKCWPPFCVPLVRRTQLDYTQIICLCLDKMQSEIFSKSSICSGTPHSAYHVLSQRKQISCVKTSVEIIPALLFYLVDKQHERYVFWSDIASQWFIIHNPNVGLQSVYPWTREHKTLSNWIIDQCVEINKREREQLVGDSGTKCSVVSELSEDGNRGCLMWAGWLTEFSGIKWSKEALDRNDDFSVTFPIQSS